jgi:hypothetical protein
LREIDKMLALVVVEKQEAKDVDVVDIKVRFMKKQ